MEVSHNSKSTIVFFEKTKPSPFDFLPDDLLRHIFSFLKPQAKESWNIVLVNRKWCLIGRQALDPSFNGNFWLISAFKAQKLEVVLWLLSDKRVNLSQSSESDNEVWVPLNNLDPMETDSDKDDISDDEETPKTTMTIGQRKKNAFTFVLQSAFKNGSVPIVQKFLTLPIDPNERFENEGSALEMACSEGEVEVVRILLKDPRIDLHYSEDLAFCLACENGHLAVVEEFLNDPRIDPSQRKDNASLVLSMANHTSDVALRLLEDPRIDPSRVDNQPLKEAIEFGKLDVVQRLMEDKRVKVSAENLLLAVKYLNIRPDGDELLITQLLEDKQFDFNEIGVDQLLHTAMTGAPIKIFSVLFKDERISARMDVNGIWNAAILARRFDVVELFMKDPRCDPSIDNNVALVNALVFSPEIALLLLEDSRVSKTMNIVAIMNAACFYGRVEIVEELLKDERNPLSDSEDKSLEYASGEGHTRVVQLLLKQEFSTSRLHMAFDIACLKGRFEIVREFLKDQRIDPSANENKALISAAQNMHTLLCNELLKDPRVKALALKQYEVQRAKRKPEKLGD